VNNELQIIWMEFVTVLFVVIYDSYLRRPRKPTKWTRIADVPAEIRTEYFHYRSHNSVAGANCSVSEIQPGHANTSKTARVKATRASGDNTHPAPEAFSWLPGPAV
jgi:hypothetical protein